MHVDRRFLLKTFAATGLSVSGVERGWAKLALTTADESDTAMAGGSEMLIITSSLMPTQLNQAFIAGVRNIRDDSIHASLQGLDSKPFHRLSQLLLGNRPMRVIGLLDDACATLTLDLARFGGRQILAVHHHRANADASPWAHRLGRALADDGPLPDHLATATIGNRMLVSFRCLI